MRSRQLGARSGRRRHRGNALFRSRRQLVDDASAGIVNSFTIQIFNLLLGFAFAALILNTPGAIVGYFALPTALSIVNELLPAFKDSVGEWIDSSPRHQVPVG